MRRLLSAALLTGIILILARPAFAVVDVSDATDEHGNIGAMIIFDFSISSPSPQLSILSSGAPISERHFLYAAPYGKCRVPASMRGGMARNVTAMTTRTCHTILSTGAGTMSSEYSHQTGGHKCIRFRAM